MSEKPKSFAEASNIMVVSPKVKSELCLRFVDLNDLPALISFVGTSPTINPDMSLQFKKQTVKPGSYIFRNEYGEVTAVKSEKEMEASFELRADQAYTDKFANKVTVKFRKAAEAKSKS